MDETNNQQTPPQPTPDVQPVPTGPPPTESPQVQQQEQSTPQQAQSNGMSHDNKTLITVLLLIFVPPIGVVFMFLWMKNWPTWLKILILLVVSAIILIPIILILAGIALVATNPGLQMQKAQCATSCEGSLESNCIELCMEQSMPTLDSPEMEIAQ